MVKSSLGKILGAMRFSLSLSKKQCWWIDHTRRLIANLSLAKWKYRHASKAELYVWGTQFWKIGCLVWLIYRWYDLQKYKCSLRIWTFYVMGNGGAKYDFGLIAHQLSANCLVQTPSADVNDKWTKLLKIPGIHSFDSDGMMRTILRGNWGKIGDKYISPLQPKALLISELYWHLGEHFHFN